MASQTYFKNFVEDSIIYPEPRYLPADFIAPKFSDLVHLALVRVADAAVRHNTRPPRLFPTTETVFARYHTCRDWLKYGDMETEMGRMNYMLSSLSERGIPKICTATIQLVLSSSTIFMAWKRLLPLLEEQVEEEMQWVIWRMQEQHYRQRNTTHHEKSDFIATPVDYRTDSVASRCGNQLWTGALSEIAVQASRGHFEYAHTFLQIYSFLKDPLGSLGGILDKAVDLFAFMMSSMARMARQKVDGTPLSQARWMAASAQAAQEALFLASPLLERINYIHFTGHQQLPYTYIPLDKLPRSEFSTPAHVLEIIEEMLANNIHSRSEGSCLIAPIAISSYPSLPLGQGKQKTIIIDGNHRATAAMILRLIAKHPDGLDTEDPSEILEEFCVNHKIGPKWKVDLAEVLLELRNSHLTIELMRNNMEFVQKFRGVNAIPALVVREDDFHTVCQQRPGLKDRPRLLLPIHQAIFNDEALGFALPQAGQVHGRALGFKPLPLILSKS